MCSSFFLHASSKEGEGAHHASISDLIPPAVNFTLLMLLLIWKVGPALKNHFHSLRETLEGKLGESKKQAEVAKNELMLATKKLKEINEKQQEIRSKFEADLAFYEKEAVRESEVKAEKMVKDFVLRLDSEKKVLTQKLMEEVMMEVELKSKEGLLANKNHADKIAEKIAGKLIA